MIAAVTYKNEKVYVGDEVRWCDNVAALRHTTTMLRAGYIAEAAV